MWVECLPLIYSQLFFARQESKKYHLTLRVKKTILTGTLPGNGSDSIEKSHPVMVSIQFVFCWGTASPQKILP